MFSGVRGCGEDEENPSRGATAVICVCVCFLGLAGIKARGVLDLEMQDEELVARRTRNNGEMEMGL